MADEELNPNAMQGGGEYEYVDESWDPLQDPAFKEMMSLFDEKTYWQRLKLMFEGLAKPKNTKDYKFAKLELQRQVAPMMAILIPVIAIIMLAIFGKSKESSEFVFETEIMDFEEVEELEEVVDNEPPPPEDFEPMDVDFTPQMALDTPAPAPGPASDAPMSPQPQAFDAVMQIKSPVILRNIYGSTRNTGMRGQLIAAGGGNKSTEEAVMRALRWLKKNQNKDGSWPSQRDAMTALCILTFLAHGERPGESREFGETVQKALEYLISTQRSDGSWAGSYQPYICTYAMCEAYGMTMNPNVRDAAERGLTAVLNKQSPAVGGWDYFGNGQPNDARNDTSVMGWAAQALHAAEMANFYSDPERLNRASKLAVKGFLSNCNRQTGGFGYCGPGNGGLTAVGTLCLQFHGGAKLPEVEKALDLMESWRPVWKGPTPENPEGLKGKPVELKAGEEPVAGSNPQYYAYYATQAKFQEGGKLWDKWNNVMWPSYVKAQFVEEDAIEDADGKLQDIGYWANSDVNTDGGRGNGKPVMDTCLAALQLMVYYRYLPTFKKVDVPAEIVGTTQDNDDITVEVDL